MIGTGRVVAAAEWRQMKRKGLRVYLMATAVADEIVTERETGRG